LYMAPTFLGGDAKSLLSFTSINAMADKINVEISDIRLIGKDWRITCMVNH